MQNKQQIRTQLVNMRSSLSAQEKSQASASIQNKLLKLMHDIPDNTPLLSYASTDMEVDTRYIFAHASRRLFAPVTQAAYEMIWREVTDQTIWKTGLFNIREPVSGTVWIPELGHAVLICPLIGFDRCGHRVGYGKGYFDRWIGRFSPYLMATVGLAFSCQEVTYIPDGKHDIPMDKIITENEVIICRTS